VTVYWGVSNQLADLLSEQGRERFDARARRWTTLGLNVTSRERYEDRDGDLR